MFPAGERRLCRGPNLGDAIPSFYRNQHSLFRPLEYTAECRIEDLELPVLEALLQILDMTR